MINDIYSVLYQVYITYGQCVLSANTCLGKVIRLSWLFSKFVYLRRIYKFRKEPRKANNFAKIPVHQVGTEP